MATTKTATKPKAKTKASTRTAENEPVARKTKITPEASSVAPKTRKATEGKSPPGRKATKK